MDPLWLVSIHAPARGATLIVCACGVVIGVSIHAPARGATDAANDFKASYVFQSTRPRGARQTGGACSDQHRVVSIHAPARGATR